MGLSVVGVSSLAWYVSLTKADWVMSLTMLSPLSFGPADLAVFYILMTVMMVAMMLPATLPIILGFRQFVRTKGAVSVGAPARFGITAFMAPYFLVWGGFGVVSLIGLEVLGFMGPMMGLASLIPGFILIAAGAYQATTLKEACLRQCQSPFTFVLGRWRKGLGGAFRMGLSHSKFCLGCCWMFMVVLFVSGAMSLLWMGVVSIMIFIEKVGIGKTHTSRAIGAFLILLGILVSVQALSSL